MNLLAKRATRAAIAILRGSLSVDCENNIIYSVCVDRFRIILLRFIIIMVDMSAGMIIGGYESQYMCPVKLLLCDKTSLQYAHANRNEKLHRIAATD